MGGRITQVHCFGAQRHEANKALPLFQSRLVNGGSIQAFGGEQFQCFAGTTASARLGGSVPACGRIVVDDLTTGLLAGVPSTYLSNGLDAQQEFAATGSAPGMVADDSMNNAVFSMPEVIRVQASDKMWVKFSWTRADGIRDVRALL